MDLSQVWKSEIDYGWWEWIDKKMIWHVQEEISQRSKWIYAPPAFTRTLCSLSSSSCGVEAADLTIGSFRQTHHATPRRAASCLNTPQSKLRQEFGVSRLLVFCRRCQAFTCSWFHCSSSCFFHLPRRLWSTLNHFRTGQRCCAANLAR